MTNKRQDARRDKNEPGIFNDLSAIPFLLVRRSDWVDIIVQNTSTNEKYFLEVKMPDGKLTKNQKRDIEAGWDIQVVRTTDEALEAVGVMRA